MTNVLISAAGLCGATIIGAILGFFVKELPHKWNDAILDIVLESCWRLPRWD